MKQTITLRWLFLLLVLASFSWSQPAWSQVRSGMGYLKLAPGARQVGISGTLAGGLDFNESFYINPAATGLSRDWQWSASYTNWLTDVYNASFLASKLVRTPWSRWSKIGLAANYLGVPEFDSSDNVAAPVSANNLLLGLNFGQPLDAANHISLGANVKYFRSRLADFDAQSLMADVGLLYRTPRLRLTKDNSGFLDYAIFSAGLSVANLGKSVTFLSESTPLPRTIRAGIAVNLGSHRGLQVSVAADYHKTRDENSFMTIGSEVAWGEVIALRWGYRFEDHLLGKFSFGAGIRLDDRVSAARQALPGRGNAMRFDLAGNQSSDFSSSLFHGSVTHFPIGPEPFRVMQPAGRDTLDADSVRFAWEHSVDRDLYDELGYWLMVDSDSLAIVQAVQRARSGDETLLHALNSGNSVAMSRRLQQKQTSATLNNLKSGDYYYAVLAHDSDNHIRLATRNEQDIGRFHIAVAELHITDIRFDYSPWITQDDYQGTLHITIANLGQRTANDFHLDVFDSTTVQLSGKNMELADEPGALLASRTLPAIPPDETITASIEWRTSENGLHHIIAEITEAAITNGADVQYLAARDEAAFYTIPKGALVLPDTVLSQTIRRINYELPYVGKVFFDSLSAEVAPRFTQDWVVEPLLATLAERLQENPEIKIDLLGTADPNSGEHDVALAQARAQNVFDILVSLGADAAQIEILPGMILPERRLPRYERDARWLLQERRRVDVITPVARENRLFRPLKRHFNERTISPAIFRADVVSALRLQSGALLVTSANLADSTGLGEALVGSDVRGDIHWQYHETSGQTESWHDKPVRYRLALVDSLGRRFRTRPGDAYLQTRAVARERMYFGIAKFGVAEPLYSFYRDNLLERLPELLARPQTRLKFVGHACPIGPEAINEALSKRRAHVFHQNFLKDVQARYPEELSSIKQRLDQPRGYGEDRPFTFLGPDGGEILMGDNTLPTGRQLNRRIMAVFYDVE